MKRRALVRELRLFCILVRTVPPDVGRKMVDDGWFSVRGAFERGQTLGAILWCLYVVGLAWSTVFPQYWPRLFHIIASPKDTGGELIMKFLVFTLLYAYGLPCAFGLVKLLVAITSFPCAFLWLSLQGFGTAWRGWSAIRAELCRVLPYELIVAWAERAARFAPQVLQSGSPAQLLKRLRPGDARVAAASLTPEGWSKLMSHPDWLWAAPSLLLVGLGHDGIAAGVLLPTAVSRGFFTDTNTSRRLAECLARLDPCRLSWLMTVLESIDRRHRTRSLAALVEAAEGETTRYRFGEAIGRLPLSTCRAICA